MSIDYSTVIGYAAPLSKEDVRKVCEKLNVSNLWEHALNPAESLEDEKFPNVCIIMTDMPGDIHAYAAVKQSSRYQDGCLDAYDLPEDIFHDRFRQQLEDFLNHYGLTPFGEIKRMVIRYSF